MHQSKAGANTFPQSTTCVAFSDMELEKSYNAFPVNQNTTTSDFIIEFRVKGEVRHSGEMHFMLC